MTETLVTYSVQNAAGVISIDNPPVNALSSGVLEGLQTAVHALEANADVRAIVIMGGGRTFVAGADINELAGIHAGTGRMPRFHPVLNAIEDCAKPVIMAIHGTALGGGLELAMAGHYRVATPDAQVGQPEVKIGLIPGAGGTQRLPRLAGVAKAAEMCAFGEPISAQQALDAGIVDQIIRGGSTVGCAGICSESGRTPSNARLACNTRGHIRGPQKAPAESDRSALGSGCHRSGDDPAVRRGHPQRSRNL